MTYRDLLSCLSELTQEQLDQQAQMSEGSMEINSVRIIDQDVWLSEKEPPLLIKESRNRK